jgi:non-canonical purine NTP pyrophosphatase (RdgB/HAM1 family)
MKERALLVATKNPGKYREILEVLGDLDFDFSFLGDLSVEDGDFIEDGETFEENAFKKAKYYFDKTGTFALGEDSGILVDAFPGELGVKTRRWGAGEHASDEEWIKYFMDRLEGVKERGARFVCCACLYDGKEAKYFKGETRGVITEKMMAEIVPGIPISSCFIPEGMEKVYSNLSVEEKNGISHRGKAMEEMRRLLQATF